MEIYILGGKELTVEQLGALSDGVYKQVEEKLGLKDMNIKRSYKCSIDWCEEDEYIDELRLDYVKTFYSAVKTVDKDMHYSDVAVTADVVRLASDVTEVLVDIAKNVHCLNNVLTSDKVAGYVVEEFISNLRIMYCVELMAFKNGMSRVNSVMDYMSENAPIIPQNSYDVIDAIDAMVNKELGKLEVTIK